MNFLSVVSQLCGKIICLCNNAILQVVWVYIDEEEVRSDEVSAVLDS